MLLGKEKFEGVDIRVRVKGGGHVARIYGKTALSNAQDDFTPGADFVSCFLKCSHTSGYLQGPGGLLPEM